MAWLLKFKIGSRRLWRATRWLSLGSRNKTKTAEMTARDRDIHLLLIQELQQLHETNGRLNTGFIDMQVQPTATALRKLKQNL